MKILMRNILITISFGSFFAQSSQAVFQSDIFTYDDVKNAKGLHVTLKGNNWQATDVKEQDIAFHQQLFSNPQVMAGFADGQTRTPNSTKQRVSGIWLPRFQNGQPHGGMTVSNLEDKKNFGHIVAGGGEGAGVSEIAYSYMPAYWGKGMGYAVLEAIVNPWAIEVRRIALGEGLDELQDANIIKKFNCFGGQPLNRFDATASPSNTASYRILEKCGFKAAASNVQKQ